MSWRNESGTSAATVVLCVSVICVGFWIFFAALDYVVGTKNARAAKRHEQAQALGPQKPYSPRERGGTQLTF